ncbi:unnamed protein product [Mytilus edulis]|uniref:Uncharacterized protein n=1 Tax=Mytilus edulis TaxID=6550 RepID=A0A8S3U6E9_MYTED|nr:unnamed protein product [Mytilus edulis]
MHAVNRPHTIVYPMSRAGFSHHHSFRESFSISVETLLHEIERVLQSCEQFVLDESLEIEMTHVDLPVGGTKHYNKLFDLDRFLKTKPCILTKRNKDEICCARALITTKANIETRKMEQYTVRKKIQEQFVVDLHNFAKGPFINEELKKIKQFQTVLPGYQICIVSKQHFNGIIYHGPDAEKKKDLLVFP